MASISEIKEEFAASGIGGAPALIEKHAGDSRAGVQKLLATWEKKLESRQKELERLYHMARYERQYYEKGCRFIAGVDEVGRGPLAGPVVAGAVILPEGAVIEGINDSKKLSPEKRERLFDIIADTALAFAIGIVDVPIIDDMNILNATKLAMARAVEKLEIKPQVLLIDALAVHLDITQEKIVKGDEKSVSIAAASIMAKVTRDRMMAEYAYQYPQYGFGSNKGYGSNSHIEAIKKYGPCPIHRSSFLGNILA